jgi:hypothetical protein
MHGQTFIKSLTVIDDTVTNKCNLFFSCHSLSTYVRNNLLKASWCQTQFSVNTLLIMFTFTIQNTRKKFLFTRDIKETIFSKESYLTFIMNLSREKALLMLLFKVCLMYIQSAFWCQDIFLRSKKRTTLFKPSVKPYVASKQKLHLISPILNIRFQSHRVQLEEETCLEHSKWRIAL